MNNRSLTVPALAVGAGGSGTVAATILRSAGTAATYYIVAAAPTNADSAIGGRLTTNNSPAAVSVGRLISRWKRSARQTCWHSMALSRYRRMTTDGTGLSRSTDPAQRRPRAGPDRRARPLGARGGVDANRTVHIETGALPPGRVVCTCLHKLAGAPPHLHPRTLDRRGSRREFLDLYRHWRVHSARGASRWEHPPASIGEGS